MQKYSKFRNWGIYRSRLNIFLLMKNKFATIVNS